MNKRYSMPAFFVITLLTACHAFQTPEIRLPYKLPVQVLRWEHNQPVIRIETPCYNQNNIGFTFLKGQMDMYLDTFYLGHAMIDTSFSVGARKVFMVPVELKVDIVPMIKHGLKLDSVVVVRVDGEMSGSAMGIHKTLPIHFR